MIQIEKKFEKLPNINNSYGTNKGFRFKKPIAVKFQREWFDSFSRMRGIICDFDDSCDFLEVTIEWKNPKYFTKKGVLSKRCGDIDSFQKFLLDGVSQGIGFDDSYFKRKTVIQDPSEDEFHHIKVSISVGSL